VNSSAVEGVKSHSIVTRFANGEAGNSEIIAISVKFYHLANPPVSIDLIVTFTPDNDDGIDTENTRGALSPQDFKGLVAIMRHDMMAHYDHMKKLRASSDGKFVAIFDYRENPPKIRMEPRHKGVSLPGDDPLLKYHPDPQAIVKCIRGTSVDARTILPFGKDVFVYEELNFEVGDDGNLF
jgi:hypothetical protein